MGKYDPRLATVEEANERLKAHVGRGGLSSSENLKKCFCVKH